MTINKIKSIIKGIWNFLVGISNIISCFFSVVSCYVVYIAVSEVISLNVEMNQFVEASKKDSVIIVERPVPISVPQDSISKKSSDKRPNNQPVIEEKTKPDSDSSPYLSSFEIDEIRWRRDEFLKRMCLLFGNRKRLQ